MTHRLRPQTISSRYQVGEIMKLVLSSVLLLLCVSATSLDKSFMRGLAQGLHRADYCAEHQEECGEMLGHLVSMLYHGRSLTTINWPNFTNLDNFLYGLANGIKNPNKTSNCYQDVNRFIGDVIQTYTGVIGLVADINIETVTNLGCDVNQFYQFTFDKDCNFQALLDILENMTEDELVHNYLKEMCPINDYIIGVKHCGGNYKNCGYNIGRIFSLLVNWYL